jgi:hypothetical protein
LFTHLIRMAELPTLRSGCSLITPAGCSLALAPAIRALSFYLYFFTIIIFNQYFVHSSHPDGGIAYPAVRLLAKNTRRVFFGARPCHPGIIILSILFFTIIIFNQYFVHSSHPDGGIAYPAVRLLAKNTRRVFFGARPCHPGINQSSVFSRQSSVFSPQSSVFSPQSSVFSLQSLQSAD